jgi:hypothetical protein
MLRCGGNHSTERVEMNVHSMSLLALANAKVFWSCDKQRSEVQNTLPD